MGKEESDAPNSWGRQPVSSRQVEQFATHVTKFLPDQAIVARNLLLFPQDILVRGVFFEGIYRIVTDRLGNTVVSDLQNLAGLAQQTLPFRQYLHRDFYKLYYLVAQRLYPRAPLPEALRFVARSFFPIFRNSIVGKTMSALMGDDPKTLLPLLAKAYNISVEGNEHQAEPSAQNGLIWRCTVEPVAWYEETFTGILEGTLRSPLCITTLNEEESSNRTRYVFKISWE